MSKTTVLLIALAFVAVSMAIYVPFVNKWLKRFERSEPDTSPDESKLFLPLDTSHMLFTGDVMLPSLAATCCFLAHVIIAVDADGKRYVGPNIKHNREACHKARLNPANLRPPMCGSGYEEPGEPQRIGNITLASYPKFLRGKPLRHPGWQKWVELVNLYMGEEEAVLNGEAV